MKLKTFILFFLTTTVFSFAQDKMSKADKYFYEYAYAQAITEYQKEKTRGVLTSDKLLNLANSYFKTANYKEASKIYLDVHKSNAKMSSNHFNMMLQSIAKTSTDVNRIKAFLNSKSDSLSSELMENANLNYKLFESSANDISDFQVFNINANSPQVDFSPAFYKDKLLFSSGRIQKSKKIYAPSGESYLDIYVSRMEPSGNIFSSVKFTGMPASKFHKSTPYYSKKLNKIFYVLSNIEDDELSFDDNGKNALAIGVVDENNNFNFLLKDLSTSFYYPFYDELTGKLFFAANFEGGYGGTDIYYVYTNNGQIMSAPVNLGPRINSPGNEIAPFIFENSLYFSSDIFYGIGGMDVYKTNISEDQQYSIPVNLGKGINSAFDDFGLIIKKDAKKGLLGYFSSNRPEGKGKDDIYGFKVDERPGFKTLTVRGRVVNLISNKGISKAQVRLLNKEGDVIKDLYTNEDGEYRIEIPWQEGVTIQSTKEKYSTFSANYGQDELDGIQKKAYNMGIVSIDDLVEEKEEQTVIKLKKFYFDRGKAEVTPEIESELDKAVDVVQKFPQFQLRIESHTDSRGGSSTNFKLSQKRADAIKIYLLKKGVSSSNILYSIGYGEDKITNICKNGVFCLDTLHKQNERTLIVVLNYNILF